MKILAGFILLLMELLVLAMALNGVLADSFGLSASPILDLVPWTAWREGLWIHLVWLGVGALPIAHWALLYSGFRKRKTIVFKASPTESLSLTKTAVIECVREELADVPAVTKHKVLVDQVGPLAFDIVVELEVRPIENIPELQARLARSIRQTLMDILSIENIRKIKIDVKSIKRTRADRRAQKEVPPNRRLEAPIKQEITKEASTPPAEAVHDEAAADALDVTFEEAAPAPAPVPATESLIEPAPSPPAEEPAIPKAYTPEVDSIAPSANETEEPPREITLTPTVEDEDFEPVPVQLKDMGPIEVIPGAGGRSSDSGDKPD